MNVSNAKVKFDKNTAHITRPGVDKLIAWLETTDFFKAPASTKFHGNYEGGLLAHSLYVTEFAINNYNYGIR